MDLSQSQMSLSEFERDFPYQFQDRGLLVTAFVAGDIDNPDNREGHRSLAQIGVTIMPAAIVIEGFTRGISRQRRQKIISSCTSQATWEELARERKLDRIVRISERQRSIGPQPKTLKNTLAAIVGAVFLDSKQLAVVAQVMEWLGLVDHEEPDTSPTNQTAIEPSRLSTDRQVTQGAVHFDDVVQVNFDACDDLDMTSTTFPHEPTCSPPDQQISTELADLNSGGTLGSAVDASQLMYGISAPLLAAADVFDMVNPIPEDMLLATQMSGIADPPHLESGSYLAGPATHGMLNSWSSSRPPGTDVALSWNQLAPHADHGIPCSTSIVPLSQPKKQKNPIRQRRISNKIRTNHIQDIDFMFQAFLKSERQKLPWQDAEYAQHCTRLLSLKNALTQLEISNQISLAKMAISLGNSSAMRLLKHAIAGARSSSVQSFRMPRNMSVEQRLKTIRRLDDTTAASRLARRLQILMLYKEATQEVGGQDADGFVMVSSPGYGQTVQGNPRYQEQSAIALHMRGQTSSTDRVGIVTPEEKGMLKNLRRIGKRLQRMVRQWGPGVLALMDQNFSDFLLMKVNDHEFDRFVEIMNHVEGPAIHNLSSAAARAIPLFCEGEGLPSRFQIEERDVVFERLPWLSPAMAALFEPSVELLAM